MVAVAVLSQFGCAVSTKPLTDVDRNDRISSDMQQLFAAQEPVAQPITLAEAIARAIKYNVEHRVSMMEQAVATRSSDVAEMELLPQMAVSAGYTNRSNQQGATAFSLLTGTESLEPSTTEERQRNLAEATVAWNVLDFGVSYVTAKQRQDQIRITEERRRKAVQNIVQDVIESYWPAWSAQELLPEMDNLLEETQGVIAHLRRSVEKGAKRKKEALEYERHLLDTHLKLWRMRELMALDKTRLASVMNLPPGTDYVITPPEQVTEPKSISSPMDELETKALSDRPELREEDYQLRVTQLEARKALLRMFPGIEIDLGANYDSNEFLFNNSWANVGIRLTWNIFNFFTGGAEKKFQEARVELADARRAALSMAVMTQVRLAVQRYELARRRFKSANDLANVDSSLLRIARADGQTQTKLDVIRTRTLALESEMRKDIVYGEMQSALARVFNSIGADPLPSEVESYELESLVRTIENHWQHLLNTYVSGPSLTSTEEPPVKTGPQLSADDGETIDTPKIDVEKPDKEPQADGLWRYGPTWNE
ncbi:MAG: TolC family protein [Arenicellales bacterium]|nr:TolC family protein [Arenicellales bacterium]